MKRRAPALTEEALALRAAFDNLPDGVCMVGPDLTLMGVNKRFLDVFQLPRSLVRRGARFEDLVRHLAERGEFGPGDVEATVRDRLERFGRGDAKPMRHSRPDGTALDSRSRPLPGGGVVVSVIEADRPSGSRLPPAEILDSAGEAIISVDANDCIALFNKGAERLFQYPAHEILGRDLEVLLPSEARVLQQRLLAAFDAPGNADQTTERRRSVVGRRKDGTRFEVEASISAHAVNGERMLTAILRDVTERNRSERELKLAMRQAELANRAKDEFLANMSHELRTPLNAILGFAQILEREMFGPLGSPKYLEYARDIYASGEHLLAVINDILDLAKTVSGKAELEETEVVLADVIAAAHHLVASAAEAAAVRLSVDIPGSLPWLKGDERRIMQVLLNLLSNAIKFTPEGGRVEVTAGVGADGSIVIEIADNGIGIAEEDLVKVFAPFGQVEEPLTRTYQGTGLGLPITRAFIELHGGELKMISRAGEGTKVTIIFPPERAIHPDHETACRPARRRSARRAAQVSAGAIRQAVAPAAD